MGKTIIALAYSKPNGFSAAASPNLNSNARNAALVDPQPGQGSPVIFLSKHGVMDKPNHQFQVNHKRPVTKNNAEITLNWRIAISIQMRLDQRHVFFTGSSLNRKPINDSPYPKSTASQQFCYSQTCIPQHEPVNSQAAT
jgi:hypothetical protein